MCYILIRVMRSSLSFSLLRVALFQEEVSASIELAIANTGGTMSIEELLVSHTSPTLADIKPASLVNLALLGGQLSGMPELGRKGIAFMPIQTVSGCSLLLVYRPSRVAEAMKHPAAERILKAAGYDTSDPEGAIAFLRERFRTERCPHEVGIFLGYPAEDVAGFIANNGMNALASGIWKVYSDTERAGAIGKKWMDCRRKYMECFRMGMDISRLCVSA